VSLSIPFTVSAAIARNLPTALPCWRIQVAFKCMPCAFPLRPLGDPVDGRRGRRKLTSRSEHER
jgi:hypothetical protein